MWNDRFHEYLSGQLKSKPGKTIEFHVLDKRMIVTDNPDNIREVMSTQVLQFQVHLARVKLSIVY